MNQPRRIRRRCGWLIALSCAVMAFSLEARGALAAAGPDSVESGKKALASRARLPWYDAEKDSLRPIQLPAELPEMPKLSVLNWMAMIGLAIVVACLVYLIVQAILQRRDRRQPEKPKTTPLLAADQIEALPFMVDRAHHDLLGQARLYYQQGNFSEAIIYLFSYELLQLDKSALIFLAKGKTNRQYLREIARLQQLKRLLESTMVTFEDVFFGQRPLDRGGFEACWNRLSEFDTLIAQAATG